MSTPSPTTTVTISVDLAYSPSRSFDEMATHDQFTRGLRSQLREAGLTALWSVADPGRDDLIAEVHAEGHATGILADRGWWVPGITRKQLDRQLHQRLGGARAAGLQIHSVATPFDISAHHDLLVSHGVTAVRTGSANPRVSRPSPLRFGLWDTPATCQLPATSKWGLGGAFTARRSIQKTAAGGVASVVFDLVKLAANSKAGLRATGNVIGYIRSQCDQGVLRQATLAGVLESLQPVRPQSPMKSILRAA